jgi:hypothetical protein
MTLKVFSGLEVKGVVAIRGGSPAAGKVLTSDADGDATWETPDVTQAELDAKANTAGGIPSDFVYEELSPATTRSVGGTDRLVGMYVGRAFTLTKVVYQFDSADALGNTSVEVRRNGSQVASSNLTISAANQADGTGTDSARTATPNQSFAIGDRVKLQITAVGTTPGKGLKAYLFGTWN